MSPQVRRFWQFTLLAVLVCAPASANNRYDPRLRFRTLSTEHFDIHFHQGEDAQARRLAAIAEQVAGALSSTLGRPDSRVHVILVDQNDLANGWATPVPYNVMELAAAAPAGDSSIGNTADWLRLVFTHEYTHIVHLSRRRGWLGRLHNVFGRLPLAYPNLFLPTWQIEGLAVFEEGALTHDGRIPAPDFGQIVERAAGEGRFEPLDRTNGGLIDWPSGAAPYAYGGYFQQYLAERYGEASLARLTDQTAGRVPFFGAGAYEKVFGRPLGELWREFREDSRRRAGREAIIARRLTHHGFNLGALRFGSDGRIFYTLADPHGFPTLRRASLDGSHDVVVARRYLGNRTALAGRVLVFDQFELANNVALQSDLFAVDAAGGAVTRLTRGGRAGDPDVSPGGTTIVCTVQRADRRDLVTMPFDANARATGPPVILLSEPGVDYSSPRWSPDGRWIAAERRRLAVRSEIVLVDARSAQTRVLASVRGHRSVTPVWTPDGASVIFASDAEGGPFRILRAEVGTGAISRLEGTGRSSVRSPDVSPDGATLAYIGYTVDGHDVFTLDLASARWSEARVEPAADGVPGAISIGGPAAADAASRSAVRPYAPWRTLAPTLWTPTAASDNGELVVGAATGAVDVLGRQGYAVDVGWSASRGRPDWRVAYAYDRWRPTFFVDLSDDTDPFRSGEIRSREADVGLLLPFRHVRWSQSLFAAWNSSTDTIDCPACAPALDVRAARRSMRGGWSVDSSKSYGYSISAEEGARVTAATEFTRRALGADADAGAATVDARTYVPAFPRHAVLAARFAAARAWGEAHVRRRFSASGAGPQGSGFDFGLDAIGLLRGFPEDDVTGERAWVVNLDYRLPIARPQRGVGTFPAFLRTVHAALFADAGDAWTPPSARRVHASAGIELSIDTVLGYALPLTLTGGAAWRHDPAGRGEGYAFFTRIGRAF